MRKKNVYFTKIVFFMVIAALLAFSGCASFPVRVLQERTTAVDQQNNFTSLILLRLKAEDHTGTFSKSFTTPQIYIRGNPGSTGDKTDPGLPFSIQPKLPRSLWNGRILEGGWFRQDNVDYFDALVVAEVIPGEYTLDYIYFYISSGSSRSGFGTVTYITTTTNFFKVPVERTYRIPAGKMAYLGEFQTKFTEKEVKPGQGAFYTFIHYVNGSPAAYEKDIPEFQGRYPELYAQFGQNAEYPLPALFVERFSNNSRNWYETPVKERAAASVVHQITQGKYQISSQADSCYWAMVNLPRNLPVNYDIELDTFWNKGANNNAYGLSLGSNLTNCYQFGTSADGGARIWLFIESKYQQPEPMAWKNFDFINKNGINHLKLEVRGKTISFLVNNQFVSRIQEDLNFSGGSIGMTACGKQSVSFDNLVVTEKP